MNAARRVDALAACWILLVTALLMGSLGNAPLWQDEAESALNSLTISSGNLVPKGSATGNPALLHEWALYHKTDDPKYEYLPTHFMETPFVTLHGWLPIYFIRMGMEMFDGKEFGPRFFSAIFFGLTLAVLYALFREGEAPWAALAAMVFFSLVPTLLGFAIQARYYSYAWFFHLSGIFTFWRFTRVRSRGRFAAWAVSEALLYHTYVSAFFLHQVVFAVYLAVAARDLYKEFVLYALIVGLCTVPHLLLTRFPLLTMKIPARHSIDISMVPMLLSLLEWNIVLAASCAAFLVVFVFRTAKGVLGAAPFEPDWNFHFLCFLVLGIGIAFFSFSTPKASYYPRVFLPLVPFVIYPAFSRISPLDSWKRDFGKLRAAAFVSIFLVLILNPVRNVGAAGIPELFSLEFRPNQGQTSDPSWVLEAMRYVEATGAKNPVILASFDHYVIAYYTGREADLIWPLRKEYIDGLEGDFFILVEDTPFLFQRCRTFLPEEKVACIEERTMKHSSRAERMTGIAFGGTRIFQNLRERER